MQLKKTTLGLLCLFLACGNTNKTVVIKKERTHVIEKSTEQKESKSNDIISRKAIDLKKIQQEKAKVGTKSQNIPQAIRLRLKIENGVITSNFIITPIKGNLYFDRLERFSSFTRIFLYSNVYKQMWRFDVPHRNGEFDIIGTLKK